MAGEYDPIEKEMAASQDLPSRRLLVQQISDHMEQMPEIQRKVLALYYFEGLRLRDIASAFGLTESRVCQIHAQAILAIKGFLNEFNNGDNSTNPTD